MSKNQNLTRSTRKRVVIAVANPAVATTTGWPVGFWASELAHPYHELTEAGYEIDLASPAGGQVEVDAMSDPSHDSGYSASDFVSRGFLATPELAGRLRDTRPMASLEAGDYDAIVIAGGQSPMFTMVDNPAVQATVARFYEAEKVTAALCHGVAALLEVELSDGSRLIDGKTITGFSSAEEDLVDAMVGQQVMPFRIEDRARERGARFASLAPWTPFALRDGRLITGQQQYSGRATARLIIEALGA